MNQPEQMPNTMPPPPNPQAAPVAAPHARAADPRVKSPAIACCLSAMPGLGQVYVGYYQRGFIHVLIAASIIALLVSDSLGPLLPLAAVFLAFFWLYNMIDAARRASLYNQALSGEQDIELPSDFKAPSFKGSIAGGSTVAAIGLILLLNTRFDVSLDWIEEWWPAALILFGAYLVFKAVQDRAAIQIDSRDE